MTIVFKNSIKVDIAKHIISYLSDHNEIIVPELGVFKAIDKPSEVQGNIISPPGKVIEYDSSIDTDDGVFIAYIAQQENLNVAQVKKEVKVFYDLIKEKLGDKKLVALNGLGVLSINVQGSIDFQPDSFVHIQRADSYGLSAVNMQATSETLKTDSFVKKDAPSDTGSIFNDSTVQYKTRENIERRKPVDEKQQPPVNPAKKSSSPVKPPKKKSSSGFPVWIIIILFIAVGLGVGFYYFYPKISDLGVLSHFTKAQQPQETVSDKQDDIDVDNNEKSDEIVDPVVAKSIDESIIKKNALKPEPVQSATPKTSASVAPVPVVTPSPASQVSGIGKGKYRLIVGSFSTIQRADEFIGILKNDGIDSEVIDSGNGLFRVSVGGSDNKTNAYNQANRIKHKPHCADVWVLYHGNR